MIFDTFLKIAITNFKIEYKSMWGRWEECEN